MNNVARLVLLSTTLASVACGAAPSDVDAADTDQAVVEAPAAAGARVTEALIGWETREELQDALAEDAEEVGGGMGVPDVGIRGVLAIQHQYSIAALRLEVPSWYLRTDVHVSPSEWGLDSSIGLAFPRHDMGTSSQPEYKASHAAAQKMFRAMTRATETTESQDHGRVVKTRASERKTFVCTESTYPAHATEFACTIGGVTNVGGTGLVWTPSGVSEK